MRTLDLDQLRAFVMAADLRSFTAAGTCLGATQSAISLRIARLEETTGRRLMARTPRAVGLTPDGTRLLVHARAILAAHDRAVDDLEGGASRSTIRLAVSDHAAGRHLTTALAGLRLALPLLVPDVVVGLSTTMREAYDRGEADAAIVRQETGRRDGAVLFRDPLAWAAAPEFNRDAREPVPLVALHGACGVKTASTRALDAAGLPWRYAFLGGSVSALQAAVMAGLGVGAFGRRHLPDGCVPLDQALPSLPTGNVVLHCRLDGETRRVLATAFRSAGER